MGSSISKSPLERRNTVLRRSQKKTVAHADSQIERLLKDIRRFKGTEKDENYDKLVKRIEDSQKELFRKSKDLLPPVRNLHARAQEKINQAEQLLETKLKENVEKANEKQAKKDAKKDETESVKNEAQYGDTEANNNVDEMMIEELERQRDNAVSPLSTRTIESEHNSVLTSPNDNRTTVELSVIKIVPEDEEIKELERSPQQKRKSIMKYGVQVLPTLNKHMSPRSSIDSSHLSQNSRQSVSSPRTKRSNEGTVAALAEVTKEVGIIEEEISNFSGKKDGPEYNRLKEQLFHNIDKLAGLPDKSDVSYNQVKRYVESCLSFLDERAIEADEDDDVFLPDNKSQTIVNGFKITSI